MAAVEANGRELMLHYAALVIGVVLVDDICRIPREVVARPLPSFRRSAITCFTRSASPCPHEAKRSAN